jgi:hypothetical protein
MKQGPTTPASVAGQLAPADYAALKASRDLEHLLKSDQRGAGAQAFARGFAAASASTFAIAAVPELFQRASRKGELQELQDISRMSQYLQEAQGMKPSIAEANAAGIVRLLRLDPNHVYEGAGNRVVAELGGVRTPAGAMYNVGSAVEAGAGVHDAAQAISGAVHAGEALPLATLRAAGPTAGTREAVLEFLRGRYKPLVDSGAAARILARRLQPVALGALPFGLMGGYEAYKRTQEQRKELRSLAGRTRGRG